MGKYYTYQYVKEFIEKEGFKLISEKYEGGNKDLIVSCPNGHIIYNFKFNGFVQGKRCRYCYGNVKITFDEALTYLSSTDYTYVSGEYKDQFSKLTFKCLHGHHFISTIRGLKSGRKCKVCLKLNGSLKKYNSSILQDKLNGKYGEKFIVIGEYIDARTPIAFKHIECDSVFIYTPDNLLRKGKCIFCENERTKWDTETFMRKLYIITSGEYLFEDEYIKNDVDSKFYHNICARSFYMKPVVFLMGCRCPYCNESKGEKAIREFLERYNITFIGQFWFEDCKIERPLRFDFCVFSGEELSLLIEYDGIQHFRPTFGKESFLRTKKSDRLKNNYCIKNSIELLRIPYTEFENIESILESNLKEKNLI